MSAGLLQTLDYGFFLPLISRFPRRMAYGLSDLRGYLHYRLRADSRRHALHAVARTFPSLPPAEARRIVLRHYQHDSHDEMEAFWYRNPLSFFSDRVEIRGLELLQRAHESSRGLLLLSGHLGSLGLLFALCGKQGFPLNIVSRAIEPDVNPLPPAHIRYARKRVRWMEEALTVPFLDTGRGNFPKLVKKLEQGETVFITIDVVPTGLKRTVPVRFLGIDTAFADGAAALRLATGARLLWVTVRYDRDLRRQLIEFEDIPESLRGLRSSQELTTAIAGLIDAKIRQYPEQWKLWDSLDHFETVGTIGSDR